MIFNTPKLYAVLLSFSLLVGCASTAPKTTEDGLEGVKQSNFGDVWRKPDIDLSGYSKIMFKNAGISYRPVKNSHSSRFNLASGNGYELNEKNKVRFEELINTEFREQLSQIENYEIVDVAGPKTLLLSIAISDLVSNVPEETFGRNVVYLSEIGSGVLMLELQDSVSGEALARVEDKRVAEGFGVGDFQRSSPPANWAVVKRLVKIWATRMSTSIDAMQAG